MDKGNGRKPAKGSGMPFQDPHGHGEAQGKLLEQAIGRAVKEFREKLGNLASEVGDSAGKEVVNPLAYRLEKFTRYIEDRRPNANCDPYEVTFILIDTTNARSEGGDATRAPLSGRPLGVTQGDGSGGGVVRR